MLSCLIIGLPQFLGDCEFDLKPLIFIPEHYGFLHVYLRRYQFLQSFGEIKRFEQLSGSAQAHWAREHYGARGTARAQGL